MSTTVGAIGLDSNQCIMTNFDLNITENIIFDFTCKSGYLATDNIYLKYGVGIIIFLNHSIVPNDNA